MFDVITIGAATRDVFLISKQFKFVESAIFETGVGECVSLGSKIDLDDIVLTTGGGATNAAVTFARLGFSTAAICRVGADSSGHELIIDLQREDVDTALIRRVRGGLTGYSTLLTAESGERSILVYRGVSAAFSSADIHWKDCQARWFYLTSLGGNLELSKRIIGHAKKCGAKIAWNPGMPEIKKGRAAFRLALPDVAVLNMNREEAQALTGKKDVRAICKALSRPGNIVLITDGSKGSYAFRDGWMCFAGTTGVKAVSQTGAGDAFGSGFVAAYMKTKNLETSLALATINAESVIQKVGAKAGILHAWPSKSLLKKIPLKRV